MLKEFGHLYREDVRVEAERRFNLSRTGSIPLDGSHSYVFEYPRHVPSVILKITHSSHRETRQILGELDFTNYLADNGVNVSRSISSASGKLVETMGADSGYFLATAYGRAPGALVDWREWTPDWFLSDFTAVIINVVVCQSDSYRRAEYDEWTSGQKMDSVAFLDYFMEPFLSGYRQMNALESIWIRRIPRFLCRHYFTFYVDALWDPGFVHLSEEEQAAEFPWRSMRQLESEIRTEFWRQFDFAKFA